MPLHSTIGTRGWEDTFENFKAVTNGIREILREEAEKRRYTLMKVKLAEKNYKGDDALWIVQEDQGQETTFFSLMRRLQEARAELEAGFPVGTFTAINQRLTRHAYWPPHITWF